MSGGRFARFSPGRAALPNRGLTRPNRCEVLDCEGIGFAARRVIPAVRTIGISPSVTS